MGKIFTKIGWVVILLLTLVVFSDAQSIRKNYRELTSAEKLVYTNALKALKTKAMGSSGSYVIDWYGNFHSTLFNAGIHQEERFTAWHRKFLQDFETELRNSGVAGASKINLPYWDWTSQYYTTSPTDRETTAPLWGSDFMGQFNSLWSLGRTLGAGGSLPTVTDKNDALALTVYDDDSWNSFRVRLENANHNGPHVWVSGIMGGGDSPKDPVFYLHHAMVDKIWQDWRYLGRNAVYPDNSLPGYPGYSASSFNDSRSIKVWYAENHNVNLFGYTATGTENYRYTEKITAGGSGSFTVPSGTTVNLVSGGLQMAGAAAPGYIILKPGFSAQAGSVFTARIDATSFNTTRIDGDVAVDDFSDDSFSENSTSAAQMLAFPNPSEGLIMVSLKGPKFFNNTYEVLDIAGNKISEGAADAEHFTVDLQNAEKGIYILKVQLGSGESLFEKLSIQ